MNTDSAKRDILARAKAVAADLEPWPDYFEFKTSELDTILSFHDFAGRGSILEIGCGNGYTAALLSATAGKVVAFDLPAAGKKSHSVGIEAARRLVERLGTANIEVVGGSVEQLPFEDNSFDAVFSEYMLHYVKDRSSAVKEMRRVLKKGGVAITVVPNFTERLFAPLIKYEYLVNHALSRIRRCAVAAGPRKTEDGGAAGRHHGRPSADLTGLIDNYLVLRPDGAYKSFAEELWSHRVAAWSGLFDSNGFKVTKTFSTQLLPMGVFDILGRPAVKFISGYIHRINKALGDKPIIKNAGYSLGLVARKV